MSDETRTTQGPGPAQPPGCRLIRTSLYGDRGDGGWPTFFRRAGIDLEAPWVQRHIAVCPRCQRRFANTGRVHLALAMLRCQSMDLGLLSRANARAIGVLQHGIRQTPKAHALRVATPEPSVFDRVRQLRGSLTQVAACLAIVILGKVGLFSSIQDVQTRGRQAMHQYYAGQVGQDVADEMFPTT